jgi:hypothetical protein
MMVYITQNYWGSRLCPSTKILKTRKNKVSGTGSISILRLKNEDTYSIGSLRKS